MKKIILILFILNYCHITAQKVLDSILLKIPNIGWNGGAHLLNWSFNDDKSQIYLYQYSHANGGQIVANLKDLEIAKEKHDEKSFFGKLLSTGSSNNSYENSIIPVVLESVINSSDLKPISSNKQMFHRVKNVPEGSYVYFKENSGITDLSTSFETGQRLENNYADLNTVFKYAPEFNKEIIKLTHIESKGEGLFGLKNVKTILVSKRGFFTYDESKGYISKTETKDLVVLNDEERLKGYQFIPDSDQKFNDKYFAWFVKEEDFSKYKLVISDDTGNLVVKDFEFEVPRKMVVTNKGVYNKDLGLKGVLNIFGYDKKGKASKEDYPANKFDVIYCQPDGEIIFNTKINHGTEKAYKKVITPILVIENDNKELEFINNNIESLFKSELERFKLDKNGVIEIISSKKYYEVVNNSRINYFEYLTDYDRIDRFGKFYIVRKIITNKIDAAPNSPSNALSGVTKDSDTKLNLTILNENFDAVGFDSFTVDPNLVGKLKFQTVENNEKEMVLLINKESLYYMVKINQTSSTPKIDFFPLVKKGYLRDRTPSLYFGAFNQNFALVHKKNRQIYFMNQYYDNKNQGTKIIDKVGITKIEY